ncbi:MAG: polyprenyl diphosphate synthase [Candidatus Marsarchaeota archaeon]|jgi:undecaprenyl diphosphate synthase|nr:polyprenyl diphosphate synthase [Candidatus Marsarchaeota archaeon]MCL5115162.1 polyprenyl diphosphate synthase [Candidatus Marsarchaeota archaeon]
MATKHGRGGNTASACGPGHIAIIPDGNRRWARLNRFGLLKGYSSGITRIIDVCIWAKRYGVRTMSIWALSTENAISRSRSELSLLYRLYTKTVYDKKILRTLSDNQASVHIVGNLSALPKRLRGGLLMLEKKTEAYKELSINLLVGYGGRDDILHAIESSGRRHGAKGKLGYDSARSMLMTSQIPDVDLIIRTSGEQRLSGILPWQSNYSELYFARKYWPDFGRADLKRAIYAFRARQRRFGR